ncbi:MAG: TldD/PmbA family protein [Elusimicrobiales bacterium]|nr:TldD/PmbA family protein [Elusimicrobiales bacterium]
MIEKDLKKYTPLFKGYTELRLQENRNTKVVFLNGNLVGNEKSSDSGISARTYQNGSWGFASTCDTQDNAIQSVIKTAYDNSVFLDSKLKKGLGALPSVHEISNNTFFTAKPRKTQKELVDFAAVIDAHILKTYKNIKSRNVIISSLDMEKSLITSDGSISHSMIPRTVAMVALTIEKNGLPIELHEVFGSRGQFEDVFEKPSDLFPKIEELYNHLVKKTEGVFPDAGNKECIFDADLAGILAHEAIGHTTESDIVLGGSVAANLMNQEVANPLITLVDFANTALGKTCPVPVYIDDEGTKAEDTVIIKDGVLKSFLHNKESAAHFKVKPTGNARGYAFFDEPLVRMRNTAILPGKSKLEDMIASVDDGYYLIKSSNGQADSTSEFMFGIVLGYEIKNGKLGRAIKDTTISGVAFDMLKTVSMVSKDMSWSCGGMCGKKQAIPVGMGGPAIKCRINIGGK